MDYVKSVRPEGDGREWRAALATLLSDPQVRLAHLESGLFAHPALGFDGAVPPPNILLDQGLNLVDDRTGPPLTDLSRSKRPLATLIEYPDHGVKTLSIVLGDQEDRFLGLAPGAVVVPYRVSNGPLLRRGAAENGGPGMGYATPTGNLAIAIDHALRLSPPPRVVTISMGNPGLSILSPAFVAAGGEVGMDRAVHRAVRRAWRAGVIVVCAAGQVIDRIVYPALWPETIAVGGFERDGGRILRYPALGYGDNGRIDVWALAVGLNRASGHRDGNRIVPTWADDDPFAGEPSGTSYACPQVAATALLWTARWRDRLDGPAFAGRNAWRRVEAFRAALRALPTTRAQAREGGRKVPVSLRLLDVERVIGTAPDETAAGGRA